MSLGRLVNLLKNDNLFKKKQTGNLLVPCKPTPFLRSRTLLISYSLCKYLLSINFSFKMNSNAIILLSYKLILCNTLMTVFRIAVLNSVHNYDSKKLRKYCRIVITPGYRSTESTIF